MRSRRIALVGLAALLLAGLAANGCGGGGTGGRDITVDGPVRLTRAFEEGREIRYKFAMDTQSGVKLTSYEQTISSMAEFKTTNTFRQVTDDAVEMAMRFDYAVGAIASGDAMVPDESVTALRGKELDLTLSPDGEKESIVLRPVV